MEGAIRIRTISAKTDAGFSMSDMDSDGGKVRSMKIVDNNANLNYQFLPMTSTVFLIDPFPQDLADRLAVSRTA